MAAVKTKIVKAASVPAAPRSSFKKSHMVKARYDAAQTTIRNSRHWSQVDNLSANSANDFQTRRILRGRSRYEYANNTYCQGIVNSFAEWMVGTGSRLQMQTDDEVFNDDIEFLWNEWSESIGLPEKMLVAEIARIRDGEDFGVLFSNPNSKTMLSLDLMVLEAERVTSLYAQSGDLFAGSLAPNNIDGIILDPAGNPVTYQILKQHPGELNTLALFGSFESQDYPADYVIHWFKPDRPEQKRGIPSITSALELFSILRDYTMATLRAAQTAADIAGVIQTPALPDDDETDGETESTGYAAFDTFPIDQGMFTVMPDGTTINQLKPEQPTTTFPEFEKRMINGMARGVNMPYNIAAGSSEGYNYSSGRLDHQSFNKTIVTTRSLFVNRMPNRIFWHFYNELMMLPQFRKWRNYKTPRVSLYANPVPQHDWMFDGAPQIDPAKAANAFDTLSGNGGQTLARWYAEQGLDWRPEIKQFMKEKDMIQKYLTNVVKQAKPDPNNEDMQNGQE
jgi:lambda family phage portal protein